MRALGLKIICVGAIAAHAGQAWADDAAAQLKSRPRRISNGQLMGSVIADINDRAKGMQDLRDLLTTARQPRTFAMMQDLYMRRHVEDYGQFGPARARMQKEADDAWNKAMGLEGDAMKAATADIEKANAKLYAWDKANADFIARRDAALKEFQDRLTTVKRDTAAAARELEYLDRMFKARQAALAGLQAGQRGMLLNIAPEVEEEVLTISRGAETNASKMARIEKLVGKTIPRLGTGAVVLMGAVGYFTFAGNNEAQAAEYHSVEATKATTALAAPVDTVEENQVSEARHGAGAPASK